MKLLLYCTKAKPYLRDKHNIYGDYHCFPQQVIGANYLNGKIVAECDFEIEKIYYSPMFCNYTTWSLGKDDLLNKSCLTHNELKNYLGTKDVIGNDGYNGYAIRIKNLHIFDKPRELKEYDDEMAKPLNKAPQNMMYAFKYITNQFQEYILISIRPEWLCKILNREKTIEVRKKVLKEMIE